MADEAPGAPSAPSASGSPQRVAAIGLTGEAWLEAARAHIDGHMWQNLRGSCKGV